MGSSCTLGGEEVNVPCAWGDEYPGGATRVKAWAAKAKGNGAIQRMARDHRRGSDWRSRTDWESAGFRTSRPAVSVFMRCMI